MTTRVLSRFPENPGLKRLTARFSISGNTANAGFATVNGRFYHGYTSADLTHWTRDDTSATVAGNGNHATWPFTPVPVVGTPARFFRVAVGATSGAFPVTLP